MKKVVTDIVNKKYIEKAKVNKIDHEVSKQILYDKNYIISNWLGMGGAITEASGYNYSILEDDIKKELLKSYYSKDGLNYDMGRISIASNDFSLRSYEYLQSKNLDDFSIEKDYDFIIPMLKDIYKQKKLELIASPWSPPAFMKTNKKLLYGGKLKGKYYPMYADYLVKFIDTYKDLGFNINYITMQNEPKAIQRWESCVYSLGNQKKFIYKYLLPRLNDTKLLLWDHNRENLPKLVDKLYQPNDMIGGVGIHWYTGGYYNNIALVHHKYPELPIINTEMCCGFSFYNEFDWVNDGENYAKDIINSMNSGVSGYLDWNILLDYNGGPSHKSNYVKSAIILNEERNNIIKTPIYYYLYHIAHFIKKGYEIIGTGTNANLLVVGAKNKKEIVMVVYNPTDKVVEYEIKDTKDSINPHSIITYTFND